MIVLVYICLLVSIVYNTYVICHYSKVPESLSETAYLFGGNKKFLFTAYCMLVVFTLMPGLFSVMPENLQFLPTFIFLGLGMSGCSPMYRNRTDMDSLVHYLSAVVAFVAFVIYTLTCLNHWWITGYLICLGGLYLWKKDCGVYFAEILALVLIIANLILML